MDIFREMYRGGGVSVAGVDPRLNASRIASRRGVSRAKVAGRLREWAEYGLLQRYDVWPNPALLGRIGFTLDIRVADRFLKEELLERLAWIDGIVAGTDFFGDWITTQYLLRAPEEIRRCTQLVRGLSGVAEVGEPIPWAPLEPARALSPLDRRIVRVLRAFPKDALSEVARRVGVSTRTMTSRYGRLVEDRAVWFVPVFDFRALTQPVVSVSLTFSDGSQHGPASRAYRKAYPQSLELVRPGFGPVLPPNVAVFFTIIPSSARFEELERLARNLPGVQSTEILGMIRMFSFPGTIDRLMDEAEPPVLARHRTRERGLSRD
ncbi:MAG: AsnC family protein [Thermoplasmata archaeon]